ncbi:hypothetical protein NEOKW01_1262 [Nematocida sp. AWRm80]|nr:hypothetical protein NEOKW01_1262 [Nematocida sp. AWRm80]
MILLNALKVLGEAKERLVVEYRPTPEIRKAFLLPAVIDLIVEVFPPGSIDTFSKADPAWYIDGHLVTKNNTPIILPCTSGEYCECNLIQENTSSNTSDCPKPPQVDIPAQTNNPPANRSSSVFNAVIDGIDILVKNAIRKAAISHFETEECKCLRVCTVLIKLNRVKEALECIRDEMGERAYLGMVLPYMIYDALCTLTVNKASSIGLDKILYISTMLDGTLSSKEEDKVINSLLYGLYLSSLKRSPSVLNLYAKVCVSDSKKALFFYTLSQRIGSNYHAGRSTLMSLSSDSFKCSSCPEHKAIQVRNELSSNTLSGTLSTESIPMTKEYSSKHESTLLSEIRISSKIGEYKEEGTENVYVPICASSEYTASSFITIYTEDSLQFHLDTPGAEIVSILITREEYPQATCIESQLKFVPNSVSILNPIKKTNETRFYFAGTCKIIEIFIKHKERTISQTVDIQVIVLNVPIPKALYSHKALILPTVIAPNKTENDCIIERISKYISSPCRVVSYDPLIIRVSFEYNTIQLYKEITLDWITLHSIQIEEKPEEYIVQPLQKDIIIKYSRVVKLIPVNTKYTISKNTIPRRTKRILWMFSDRSKSGTLIDLSN